MTPMALILRLMRNMGVAARIVVTSYVSKWWITSTTASRPSCNVNVYLGRDARGRPLPGPPMARGVVAGVATVMGCCRYDSPGRPAWLAVTRWRWPYREWCRCTGRRGGRPTPCHLQMRPLFSSVTRPLFSIVQATLAESTPTKRREWVGRATLDQVSSRGALISAFRPRYASAGL